MHDGRLLAKVLYGTSKTNTTQAQRFSPTRIRGPKTRKEVTFSSTPGKVLLHSSLMHNSQQPTALGQNCEEDQEEDDQPSFLPFEHPSSICAHPENTPCEDDPSCYVWRSQDYSFLPVKSPHQVNHFHNILAQSRPDIFFSEVYLWAPTGALSYTIPYYTESTPSFRRPLAWRLRQKLMCCCSTGGCFCMTWYQINQSFLFQRVIKILTACRMLQMWSKLAKSRITP